MPAIQHLKKHKLLWLILLLATVRLVSLAMYPLMDSTEARYAEIARKMVELNDWITPWFSYDKPFWGKPPLSFWATAISFKLFGFNEFAARLPHFLAGVGSVWLVYDWMRYKSSTQALYVTALLSGALLYFLSSGTVMTDMWMLLGIIMVMRGYFESMANEDINNALAYNPAWLIFIGLAIGLLAKGFIAVVLCGLPILAWMLITKNFIRTFTHLPIIKGLFLTLLIAAPWYVLAELKTPGFLEYFVIGEHFHRFMDAGWQGDQYGTAHDFPRGSIWAFLFVDWFPWSIILPLFFWITRNQKYKNKHDILEAYATKDMTVNPSTKDSWHTYLWCWALSTPLFFTFAGNILWPYVLPAFPAIAILLSRSLAQRKSTSTTKVLSFGLIISTALLLTAVGYINTTNKAERKSAKGVVELYSYLTPNQYPKSLHNPMKRIPCSFTKHFRILHPFILVERRNVLMN